MRIRMELVFLASSRLHERSRPRMTHTARRLAEAKGDCLGPWKPVPVPFCGHPSRGSASRGRREKNEKPAHCIHGSNSFVACQSVRADADRDWVLRVDRLPRAQAKANACGSVFSGCRLKCRWNEESCIVRLPRALSYLSGRCWPSGYNILDESRTNRVPVSVPSINYSRPGLHEGVATDRVFAGFLTRRRFGFLLRDDNRRAGHGRRPARRRSHSRRRGRRSRHPSIRAGHPSRGRSRPWSESARAHRLSRRRRRPSS